MSGVRPGTENARAGWVPGLIPSEKQGWWKPTSEASVEEITAALAWDEATAREAEASGDSPSATIHWKRWAGLHFAYVSALANEVRAELAAPSPSSAVRQ